MTLVEAFFINPGVKHFVFQVDQPFSFIPGQFITLPFAQNGQAYKRSYSLANIPAANNRVEFAASFVEGGVGTQYLFNLNQGDIIEATGPFGRLILKETDPGRYILVATSTGVTPYRSMIDQIKNRLLQNPQLSLVILQGVRKAADILYEKDFRALESVLPGQVVFRAQLSREEVVAAPHFTGHVQTAFSDLNLNKEQDLVYLCGNPAMIDECFASLKDIGFNPQQIIREKYISSK